MLISSQSPLLTTRAASSGVQSLRLYSDSYWKGIAIAFLFSVFRDMIDRLFFNRTVQKRRAEPPPPARTGPVTRTGARHPVNVLLFYHVLQNCQC